MAPASRRKVGLSRLRQKLWRRATPLYFRALSTALPKLLGAPRPGRVVRHLGVRVVGILSTATGIGQSARLCLAEMQRIGRPVSTFNVSPLFQIDDQVAYDRGTAWPRSGGLSIVHLNPPMMLIGLVAAGLGHYRRDLTVAYWAWELPELPPDWHVALRQVDAVMVPSTFCRDAVAAHTSKPVLVVPHPVPLAEPGREPPPSLRPFRVLSIFNCGSSLRRKNPAALIEAFKLAFGDDREAELVLKIADGRTHRADVAELQRLIGASPNIRLVDELMSDRDLDRLIRGCDAYASLHRSEGFGLTVAEAIMREVPVVVTGWSGTADFCRPDLAFTVDAEMVPIADPHPVYADLQHCRWAQADIAMAARRLIEIRQDPAAARERARRLRAHLLDHLRSNSYARAIETITAQTA